ncbi:dynein regulatory complex protein 9 [Drosophila sulfurigaster albostrigata]|uniref:dynein regulatory complex protein 9 n=1 Tax=Drosophila sulfurigaster albostrigata TaxID=89887 RepID=UPI002D21C12A|nr:dynein regulatory complex protein 9 [Drosophila sulfurigaster albostrigata]
MAESTVSGCTGEQTEDQSGSQTGEEAREQTGDQATNQADDDDDEPSELQRLMLAVAFKEASDRLALQQRSHRLNMQKPLPPLPASLRRLRSSSIGQKAMPERILLTGKKLPRLQSLLGEAEEDADQLDECVLNALKYERDMDALRAFFDAANQQLYMTKEEKQREKPSRLELAIGALSGNNTEESVAAKELLQSKEELKQLQAQLEQVKIDGVAKLQDYDERIADAKYNLRCVSRVNDLEFSLVERWEAARVGQAEIWGENAERAYLRDILDFKQRLSREQRVSQELSAFRSRERADLEQRIADWQQRYASELRRVERESEAWELRILELTKSLARHREENAQHVVFVNEYRAKKEEEQRLLDLQLHRIQCAIKLQAWWRGTMVRRGLGPFKKKPKRGKRGKPKK